MAISDYLNQEMESSISAPDPNVPVSNNAKIIFVNGYYFSSMGFPRYGRSGQP